MSFTDIIGCVLNTKDDEPVLAALEELAGDAGRAVAVLFGVLPDPVYTTAEGVLVTGLWTEVLATIRSDFAKERRELEQRCRRAAFPLEIRALESAAALLGNEAAVQARHADLCVMLRPKGAKSEADRIAMFEQVLFGSGRPVLLVPPNWKRTAIGRNVVVGWNGKREAARAIADATPFLERAEKVVVAAVDAKPDSDGCGEAPGVDITAHLARKKIRAELCNVDGLGRSHGEALLAEARTREADLIVIGGYGRPRLSEWIFGGVTREILERAETPVLISH